MDKLRFGIGFFDSTKSAGESKKPMDPVRFLNQKTYVPPFHREISPNFYLFFLFLLNLLRLFYFFNSMLSPKRTKYRKHHRGRMRGEASRGNKIAYGTFALQALEPGWLTSRQIEAGRRTITRYAKRGGKLWIRVFPDKPITMRPAETRMGSGKGSPEYWVAVIRPGRILYEMTGVPLTLAKEAMRNASYKMPVKTTFLTATGEK